MNGVPAKPTQSIRMAEMVHLKTNLNWIYEGSVAEPYRHSDAHFPGQSALLIEQGRLLVITEKGKVWAQEKQWVFPRQGSRQQHFSDDAKVLSIHFNLSWPGNKPLFEWGTALVLESADAPLLEKRARALERLVKRLLPGAGNDLPRMHSDLKTYFTIEKSFASWVCLCVDTLLAAGAAPSRFGHIDQRVLQAVQILDDVSLMVCFDGKWLSNEVGLSQSQLERIFIRQLGTTPRKYFEQRKHERAVELLCSAPTNIKEIAWELGFQSLPVFSRWFRAKIGLSPRQFRKSAELHGG